MADHEGEEGPPSRLTPLRRDSLAWLADPKLTLRRKLA
jgi:hypothetical protein